MTHSAELRKISEQLAAEAAKGDAKGVSGPLKALLKAAEQVGRSFSGSWLGYHATVYYADLRPVPNGARFSQQSGLAERFDSDTIGDWAEYSPESVRDAIYQSARVANLNLAEETAATATRLLEDSKAVALSIIELELNRGSDPFLSKVKSDLEGAQPLRPHVIIAGYSPRGQFMSSDLRALGAGICVPPHVRVISEVESIKTVFAVCAAGADLCNRAASHLDRRDRKSAGERRVGSQVFLGHGRSGDWRELKDFIQDRLGLPWDEFNRVPIAGVPNSTRLSQMLDDAAFALLVLTAEDEIAEGELQPRMNVVHEAGLFQGRLGFTKAIILVEEGCKEFSNVEGLGQIGFPKGRVSAAFESVRGVLEREGLLT
jgi:predicted nucleotide-binding protein